MVKPFRTKQKYKTDQTMTNNEILKKLRIALQLKDTDILEILSLAGFEMTKGALNDLFRNEDHPGYVEAGDQVLRNFLNGLIVYKRGPAPERKSPSPQGRAQKPTALGKDFFKKANTEKQIPAEGQKRLKKFGDR
ncbi:MAG: DUF1456 family protein [Saprospiraceae bacterium]|nr:DUF1456 family protein [Saprospiraceae bacterium]